MLDSSPSRACRARVAETAAELSRDVTHDLRAQADNAAVRSRLSTIEKAVADLRRRGDIVVRREDLRLLVGVSEDARVVTDREAIV